MKCQILFSEKKKIENYNQFVVCLSSPERDKGNVLESGKGYCIRIMY